MFVNELAISIHPLSLFFYSLSLFHSIRLFLG